MPAAVASGPLAEQCLRHQAGLLRYLRSCLDRPGEAEDLLQDIFARALAAKDECQGQDPRPWLYAIARNRVAEHLRRRSIERRGAGVLEQKKADGAPAAPERSAMQAEFRAELLRAMEQLSDLDREAVRLKFSGGFSNTEIAQMLNVTPGHLGVILFRALRKLRVILKEHGHEHA